MLSTIFVSCLRNFVYSKGTKMFSNVFCTLLWKLVFKYLNFPRWSCRHLLFLVLSWKKKDGCYTSSFVSPDRCVFWVTTITKYWVSVCRALHEGSFWIYVVGVWKRSLSEKSLNPEQFSSLPVCGDFMCFNSLLSTQNAYPNPNPPKPHQPEAMFSLR